MKKSRYLRKIFFLFLFSGILCTPILTQNTPRGIMEQLSLDISLKTISGMSYDELMDAAGKYIILTGSVASRTVLNPDAEDFIAQIELIDGEWDGTEQVYMYQAIVIVSGEEWIQRIPERRSRRENPLEIELSSKVLVIGRILEPQMDENGNLYRIIEGLYVRDI